MLLNFHFLRAGINHDNGKHKVVMVVTVAAAALIVKVKNRFSHMLSIYPTN